MDQIGTPSGMNRFWSKSFLRVLELSSDKAKKEKKKQRQKILPDNELVESTALNGSQKSGHDRHSKCSIKVCPNARILAFGLRF